MPKPNVTPTMRKVLIACANGTKCDWYTLGLRPQDYAKAELHCRQMGLKVDPHSPELTEAGWAVVGKEVSQ